jgi:class 3 adenylate cyclase
MINVISGLVVAALTGDSGQSLGASVLVAIGVATTISLELTLLLTRSILRPLADLRRATDAVGRGDFTAVVPVTTGDEIGELASSFNQMVSGLRERERIREAFATYLDEEVAEYILSDSFSKEGFEREVTILFCDVRNFAGFAAESEPQKVVACLNELFEIVVPLIAAEGGHVDKFEGDGLLAVFGAPRPFPDHAERAVRAALEIDRRVNVEAGAGELRLGIGINTGSVIAGSVGGGGRLNFSVIGDAVNIAARVEAETRRTGDAVLLTEATRAQLGPGFETRSRGDRDLKGIERPVAVHAPAEASSFDEGPLKILRDTIRAVR